MERYRGRGANHRARLIVRPPSVGGPSTWRTHAFRHLGIGTKDRRDRSVDREFTFEDNLRDVGLTLLNMTSLVFAVAAEFSFEIPDRAITPSNFTSVASIGRLIWMLSQHDAAPSASG
jgi:acyl carrier protein